MNKNLFFWTILFLGVTSCASTNIVSMAHDEKSFQFEEDEKRLWKRSSEEQETLDNSGHLYKDPALEAYLNEVMGSLVPKRVKERGVSIKVKVIKNPLLNAFAYPNGTIYVHTGIIAKMENEAQLATLLGHELTHVTHRHTVQNMRTVKNTTAFLATFQVMVSPFGYFGSLAGLLGTIGGMAAVTGYSRDLESEADREGLDLIVQAGYSPKESPKLFEHLKKDVEEQKVKEPFFFGSHPRLQERIDNFRNILKDKYPDKTGNNKSEVFLDNIMILLLDNVELDISIGRFNSAQESIDQFLRRKRESKRSFPFRRSISPKTRRTRFGSGEKRVPVG